MKERMFHVKQIGIDWITATLPNNVELFNTKASALFDVLNNEHAENVEEPIKPFGWQGYKGLICSGLFVGQRPDGVVFRATGSRADKLYAHVTYEMNVSRLDMQATIWPVGHVGGPLNPGKLPPHRWHEQQAILANDELPDSRKRLIDVRENNRGGATLYIGSRKSNSFGRIYNKSAESPAEWAGLDAWRYEVQLGGKLAKAHFVRLMECDPLDRAMFLETQIRKWFRKRGVIVPTLSTKGDGETIKDTIEPTNKDRQLQWLHKQVKPTIRQLIEAGHTHEMLIALFGPERGAMLWDYIAIQSLKRF